MLHPSIFRAYDIRGKAGEAFDREGFYILGRAIVKYLNKFMVDGLRLIVPKVLVSGDGRQSMPDLYQALIGGLEAEGAQVTLGGMMPTPLNYFAFHEGGFDLGLQISASHNPWYDNGLKLIGKNGAICGEALQEIRKICELLEKEMSPIPSLSSNQKLEFDPKGYKKSYEAKLKSMIPPQKPLKIIVDAGNGIAGSFYPDIFRKFGHEVIELYTDLDTRFPHHQPDPERPENLEDARDLLEKIKADYAFVFDGDGDRVGIVLGEKSEIPNLKSQIPKQEGVFSQILNADKILFILAVDFLSRNRSEKVVIDVMCSDILEAKIKAFGGQVIRSKTGHSFIEEALKHHQARLGGEQSGHFMFGENFYGHDDALLASLRFISALESHPEWKSEVSENWPSLLEFNEKFEVKEDQKFGIMERLKKTLADQFPEAILTDGVRISFGNGEWAIIRPSNTSAKIALRIEAHDAKSLESKKSLFLPLLQKLI